MADNISGKVVLNSFLQQIVRATAARSILYLRLFSPSVFGDINYRQITEITEFKDDLPEHQFDLVFADLPIGMNVIHWEGFDGQLNLRIQKNWAKILDSLAHLNDDGIGFYLVEPSILFSHRGKKFRQTLNENGFYIQAAVNPPEGVLKPETSTQPLVVAISKNRAESLFVAQLFEQEQSQIVARNLLEGTAGQDLSQGIFTSLRKFKSFYHFEISNQIERLETQYKEYEEYELSDIATISFVKVDSTHENKENAVYIPQAGNTKVLLDFEQARAKRLGYFEIVIDKTIAIDEYVMLFFSSSLGQLILKSLSMSAVIPILNGQDLAKVSIALPSLAEQNQIIKTHQQLSELKIAVEDFSQELALNPTSSTSIQAQLEKMLDSLNLLTVADAIRSLVRQGESKTVEFKQTLSLDVRTRKKEKYIEQTVLKTVCAFLNSDGGTLLVGVTDDGELPGLGFEIKNFYQSSKDKLLLHFVNLLRKSVGAEFYSLINQRIVDIDGSLILLVECQRSRTPCFLNEEEFFVRTNPATDKLVGRKQHEYIRGHFR